MCKGWRRVSDAAGFDDGRTCRLDALAKGTKGASKWWLPYERPRAADADRADDRPSLTPSAVVTPGGRSSGGGGSGRRQSYDADEPLSARSTASRSVSSASRVAGTGLEGLAARRALCKTCLELLKRRPHAALHAVRAAACKLSTGNAC